MYRMRTLTRSGKASAALSSLTDRAPTRTCITSSVSLGWVSSPHHNPSRAFGSNHNNHQNNNTHTHTNTNTSDSVNCSSNNSHNNNNSKRPKMSITIRSPSHRVRRGTANNNNNDHSTHNNTTTTTHQTNVAPPPPPPPPQQQQHHHQAAGAAAGGAAGPGSSNSSSGGGGGGGGASTTASSPHSTARAPATSHAASPPRRGSGGGSGGGLLHTFSNFTEPVKRIILIRNGKSEANKDVSTYVHTPDWRIGLVEEGVQECIGAGHQLAELVRDEPVYFYYSPYIRSRQTLRYVLQGYDEGRVLQHTRPSPRWWEEEEGDREREVSTTTTTTTTPPPTTAAPAARQGQRYEPLHQLYNPQHLYEEQSGWEGSPAAAREDAHRGSTRGAPQSSSDSGGRHPHQSDTSGGVARGGEGEGAAAAAAPHRSHHAAPLILRSGTSSNIVGVREDVRLRDGDIGRYHTIEELLFHLEQRELYGKFFYRFPHGESGADVCDRVTSFLDAFQRERVEFPMDTNVVIITHGLTIRMFVKRWFHLTVDTFHRMHSPPSGALCALTRLHHKSCFRMDEHCVEAMRLPLSLNENNGYRYRNKRLLGSMSSGAPYM